MGFHTALDAFCLDDARILSDPWNEGLSFLRVRLVKAL